jgi:hypothetical protein
MKKFFLLTLGLALFFALASIAYSAEEALTPEKLSGMWEGGYTFVFANTFSATSSCRALFTPNLNGIMRCRGQHGSFLFVFDGQGDIVNNQLIIRDQEMPNTVRLKAYITSKNKLEGELKLPKSNGDLSGFKKIRELTDEEKQLPLAQLEGLLKK